MDLLKKITVNTWLKIGLANLLLVGLFGLLMRMKALYAIPFIDQKYIMHAHSHFAFSGWLSHVLMVLMTTVVWNKNQGEQLPRKYQLIVGANVLASFGMLVSFSVQGYALYSIICSTVTVFVSYVFAYQLWRDMRVSLLSRSTQRWFLCAIFFLVLSSLGTFYLAYLMKSGMADARKQLASVYFFLHFQYNGWFFFACMGLASHWLARNGWGIKGEKWVCYTMAIVSIPLYLLSVLWWKMPSGLYLLVVLAVLLQAVCWTYWIGQVWTAYRHRRHSKTNALGKILIGAVALAASIKFMLQSCSVIPQLSTWAYSFRPVVIGYLHLVLLGVFSLFLLTYLYQHYFRPVTVLTRAGLSLFLLGVVCNELFLALQGIAGMAGFYIPYIPIALAIAAFVICIGIGMVLMRHNLRF